MSFEHTLPVIKHCFNHIPTILNIAGIAQDAHAPVLIEVFARIKSVLEPLTGQDIKKLIEPLFTVPLDQHNWRHTSA